MATRKELEAQSMGLGDAVIVAKTIEKKRKELSREFRVHGNKGVVAQSTIQKKKAKDLARQQKAHDMAYNPRIKGLAGIDGITTAEDGTIGLAELREQKPEVFDMKPMPVAGKNTSDLIRRINARIIARGGKDTKYGHAID